MGVKTLDEGPALIRDVSFYKPLFVGVAVVVVVPVVLTVLAWDELLPHVVERWSGSSALARVWVSAGGGRCFCSTFTGLARRFLSGSSSEPRSWP